MTHDLVIREGMIVDGMGGDPVAGDLAVDGDRISAVGTVEGNGKREIRADGAAITPGFIDLHTHLDAQIGWDSLLTPISWHGVTTALLGNCGVTFAPCKPKDREFLAEMMETVEDIPRAAILSGLPWDWESYGEYLNSIEALNPAINVAGMVGHCATRFYVMGERSIDEQPTEDEIREIAAIAGQAVKDGAIGFSTNRLPGHRLPDGRSIPGTFAMHEELMEISKAVGANNGLVQNVLDIGGDLDQELALLGKEARAGNTRVLFSAVAMPMREGRDPYASVEAMRKDGLDINAVTVPRSGGFLSSLPNGIFFDTPAWCRLRELDVDERLESIRNEDTRAELISEAKAEPRTSEFAKRLRWLGDGDRPVYTRSREESLYHMAQAAGEHPAETWLRLCLESNGETMFHLPFFNHDLDAVCALMKTDWVLPGLGDAGAHVSQIMDSGWPSFFLAHWHRDRGAFTLSDAIRRMTSAPARVLGLNDRGSLRVGMRADINVVDIDRVAERQPQLVADFPHGAKRLIQRAVGYKATVCNGEVILRDDEHTDARGGRLLRSNG